MQSLTRTYLKNTPARAMSEFSHNQEATTRLYQKVRRGGATLGVRKFAIARRVAAFFSSRGVTSRSQCLQHSSLGAPRGDDKTAGNAGRDIFEIGSKHLPFDAPCRARIYDHKNSPSLLGEFLYKNFMPSEGFSFTSRRVATQLWLGTSSLVRRARRTSFRLF